ncbi:putative membrane protein (plasmid) [Escherichia coli]|nr:putative membrane protein [Escherichia coli]
MRASLTIFNNVWLSIVSPVLGMTFTAGVGVADVTGAGFSTFKFLPVTLCASFLISAATVA